MGLLYVEEHLSCGNYLSKQPIIRACSYHKGDFIKETNNEESLLYFIKEGTIVLNINEHSDRTINGSEFFFIPPQAKFDIEIINDAEITIISFKILINLCENFSMLQLIDFYNPKDSSTFCVLPFNEPMKSFHKLLDHYLSDRIFCCHFQRSKIEELFVLLRAYYKKETLAMLFHPILDKEDLFFKNFVITKCVNAKNVQDLAGMANYSTSGFIKKFTRCFEESPYRWMNKRKAEAILYEIKAGQKSLKEIYTEYNLSSMSHFISFCKKNYGQTPGEIRKGKTPEHRQV